MSSHEIKECIHVRSLVLLMFVPRMDIISSKILTKVLVGWVCVLPSIVPDSVDSNTYCIIFKNSIYFEDGASFRNYFHKYHLILRLKLNCRRNSRGVLLKGRLWFSRSGTGPRILHFSPAPWPSGSRCSAPRSQKRTPPGQEHLRAGGRPPFSVWKRRGSQALAGRAAPPTSRAL